MLNTSLFLRYFLLSTIIVGLLIFLASFTSSGNLDKEVLKYANEFRRTRKLPALVMRDDLNAIARKHSEDMARGKRSFGHGGFEKRTVQIQKAYPSCTVAENVAYGSPTAEDVITQWKNSSGHRKNLLGDFKFTGIGTARDRSGTLYYTQIFVK
ncbi:MAG TPA: CAP domain-containing protein [Chitinophagaceae bacterium]